MMTTARFGLPTLLQAILAAAVRGAPAELPQPPQPQTMTDALREEQARIDLVSRLSRTVVCIFDPMQRGGGSGVIIDAEGYGLTNFHVVADMLDQRRGLGGLSDGQLYELQVLGIDPGGDVAMFRLGRSVPPPQSPALTPPPSAEAPTSAADRSLPGLPPGSPTAADGSAASSPTPSRTFEFAGLGRSDRVAVGDSVLAMGNPFVLADDYTPTVTRGVVSGVHRYQYGEGNQLLYSDCIQTDASINPGNSGGPLFNAAGELIGINGRISINTRGRFNVGVGFAISIDQIRRFMPGLRAGLLVRHGTLQATVTDRGDRVLFDRMLENAPAWNAGIRPGDQLLAINGAPIHSANHMASLLGTYPEQWPLVLSVQHDGTRADRLVRLEPIALKLDTAFVADPQVNAEAVRRLLVEHARSSLFARDPLAADKGWHCRASRVSRTPPRAGAEPAPAEGYELSFLPSRPAELKALDNKGQAARVTTFDAREALIQRGADSPKVAPTAAEALALRLLYVCLEALTTKVGDAVVGAYAHVGADADPLTLILPDPPTLEVLERQLEGAASVRCCFQGSPGGARLRQARIVDSVDGLTATLRVDPPDRVWSDRGGPLPRIELTCTNKSEEVLIAWTLELTDWEVNP